MKQVIEKTEIKFTKGQFAVNTEYTQERTGNYELRDKIAAKWENYDSRVDGCGNVNHEFFFDTQAQTFLFDKNYRHGDERYLSIYRIISPALLLYRLISTFFGSPKC